jgi:hypothetical protein
MYLFVLSLVFIALLGILLLWVSTNVIFLYEGETVCYEDKRYIVLEKLPRGMVRIIRFSAVSKTITVHRSKLKPASWAVK